MGIDNLTSREVMAVQRLEAEIADELLSAAPNEARINALHDLRESILAKGER